MCDAFPAFTIAKATSDYYLAELELLLEEVGEELLNTAIGEACRRSEFFPTIAKIREVCALGGQDRERVEADGAWAFVLEYLKRHTWEGKDFNELLKVHGASCPECGGTTWVGSPARRCPGMLPRRIAAPVIPARVRYAAQCAGGLAEIQRLLKSDCSKCGGPASVSYVRNEFVRAYMRAPVAELLAGDPSLSPEVAKQLKGALAEQGITPEGPWRTMLEPGAK